MPAEISLRLEGIGKKYRLGGVRSGTLRESLSGLPARVARQPHESRREWFWALKDIDLEVHAGERLGIIGRNGAGKSTLLKILAGVTVPTTGRGSVFGRIGALLEVGTGFHPELTGRDNIFLSGAILGLSRREMRARLDEIVDFAGVEKFLDTPLKRYSSGMYVRLAFAVAAHLEPDILIVDEVLAVGDAEFQRKCLGRLERLGSSGRTVIFVSHSMPSVLRLCERVVLLDGGAVTAAGSPTEVIRTYLEGSEGSPATRSWPDSTEAPGDDFVRLGSIAVNVGGVASHDVEISQEIEFEVTYRQLGEDAALRPAVNLHIYNEDDILVFITADSTNAAWRETPRRPGVVTARCRVPGHFLAEGRYFVHAYVSSINPTRIHASEPDAVSFVVVDHSGAAGARGDWVGDFPGVVRPLLPWTVSVDDESAASTRLVNNGE